MAGWDWLTKPETPYSWGFAFRVVVKAVILFIAFNVVFALLEPMPFIGGISIYNGIVPGRQRLPYGEDDRAYNLSLNSLEAMFATHEVSAPKSVDEFRVLLIGDSAMWGVLLRPEETLAGYINAGEYTSSDGCAVRAYNIGHPIMSLTKDLMLLDFAMRHEPDMVVWLTTLQSFPRDKQLYPPIVQNNAESVRHLITTYDLNLDAGDERFVDRDFAGRTIVGQRRELADWLRLQLFGVMWANTGIDQLYPEDYAPRSNDFEEDLSWGDYAEPQSFTEEDLAFDVIAAGLEIAGDVPLLLVNEPIFIADGENSDLRYNYWYPRWAYDEYRELYHHLADGNGWAFLDLWDVIDSTEFTDSPVHLTPDASRQLSVMVAGEIVEVWDRGD